MSETAYKSDVLIVGAGPSGSGLAALLAGQGLDVLLVDRASFPRDKTCGDGLTPRAIPVLDRLGVLGELESAGYRRILGAELHPAGAQPWTIEFADHSLGLPPYGLVVPRFDLDHVLLKNAVSRGARFVPGFHASGAVRPAPGAPVTGISGDLEGRTVEMRARLTVLAVGANVPLLRAFGLLSQMPPGINAIRGYFTGVPDLGPYFEFYFERELAPGYAWVFPLADGRANVGLGVPGRRGEKASHNLRKLLSDFMAHSPRLAGAQPSGPIKGFPLRVDFPRHRAGGDGYLMVGESLGLVNPVTGEGIDLALESAELAAPVIASALSRGSVGWSDLAPYGRVLNRRYASFFRGVSLLSRLAVGPRAVGILTRQATKKPRLARLLAGINLGMVSPWQAFSPLTWWDILT